MHCASGRAKSVAYLYARKGIHSSLIAPDGIKTEIRAGTEPHQERMAICMLGKGVNPRPGRPTKSPPWPSSWPPTKPAS